MSPKIALQLRSFTSRTNVKFALYSSSVFALGYGAGFYRYHATQPTSSIIASPPNINPEAISRSQLTEPLYHDTNSTNNHQSFSRIRIPCGKATVIHPKHKYSNKHANMNHILITIQGKGEVQYYSPNTCNEPVFHGNDNIVLHGTDTPIVAKQLKLGNSVAVPSTNWHQIINKHSSEDLVLVVTSTPTKQ